MAVLGLALNLVLTNSSYITLPMDHLVPQALTSKATPSVQDNIPVSSTSATPSTGSGPVIPSTPRRSTHSTKGIPPVRFTPTKK